MSRGTDGTERDKTNSVAARVYVHRYVRVIRIQKCSKAARSVSLAATLMTEVGSIKRGDLAPTTCSKAGEPFAAARCSTLDRWQTRVSSRTVTNSIRKWN